MDSLASSLDKFLFGLECEHMSAEPEISKAELIFDLLGKIANGLNEGLGFPIALSWSIIILLLLTIIYMLMLFVEKFIQYFRYMLFFGWALAAISVIVIATQFS